MAALHIRNLPESTLVALRERAARHGHSMQQEVRDILEAAAKEPVERTATAPIELMTVRTGAAGRLRREEIYGDAGR